MFNRRRLHCWLAATAWLVVSNQAAFADTPEPQASFALKNGWVECSLRQGGAVIADAILQITDEGGQQFGEGATGLDGQASFPAPRGASFLVEIKTGAKTADPIRLYTIDGRIEPARVLLSYGLRACCRFVSRTESEAVVPEQTPISEPNESGFPWLTIASGCAGLVLAAFWFFAMRNRRRIAS